ncbi:MAG TPA: 6-phosphogluconolactonase [Burkholderiaceae bacterium]|nr:6-phosphogluconolactonase [Burkholderiaceae bacterium]
MKFHPQSVHICADAAALTQRAAAVVRDVSRRALAARRRVAIAACGGDATRAVFEAIGTAGLPWQHVHVFASSACWPRESPPGGAVAQACTRLLELPAPRQNVHAVPIDIADPQVAAGAYEQQVRAFFGVARGELPRFDLVMMQLGVDGHAASLYPFSSSLDETVRIAVAEYVNQLGTHCVTFTAPLINQAHDILLLATGAAVADALRATLDGVFDPTRYPVQLLRPVEGTLHLLADREAAARLDASSLTGRAA